MDTSSDLSGEDLFYRALIRSYVDAPHFVERPWLAERVAAHLADDQCRFVLIVAEPGAGKTAFAAWLASIHPDWPRYFIRRDSQTPLSSGDARSLLFTLGHQLAACRPHLFRPDKLEMIVRQRIGELTDTGKVSGIRLEDLSVSPFYRTTLRVEQEARVVAGDLEGLSIKRLVAEERFLELGNLQHLALLDPARLLLQEEPAARIVVLIDALDELHGYRGRDGVLDWLSDAPELPPNVRFVLTSRPDEALLAFRQRQGRWLKEEEIGAHAGQVQADLRRYATRFATQPPVVQALGRQALVPETFVDRAVERADGNFQYLAALFRGMEQALSAGQDEHLVRLLRLEEVPGGVEALYAFFVDQIRHGVVRDTVEVRGESFAAWHPLPAWEWIYQPILGVLSVAKEPPTAGQIQAFGHIRATDRWLPGALDRLGQFLDEAAGRYRLYHATFPEFLTSPSTRTRYPACYLDPLEWHQKIVGYLLTTYGDEWAACHDEYGLNYIVPHILDAGLYDLLDSIFSDDFMNARMERSGWHMPFVEDLERVEAVLPPPRVVCLYLQVIYGRRPNSLVMQKVFRRLVRLRLRLGGEPISGVRPRVDRAVDAAVMALDLPPDEAVPALQALYGRVKNTRARGLIALALGETGSPQATPVLFEILQSAPNPVRWTAADALVALNDRAAIPWLMRRFDETTMASDRQRLLYILGRMQAREACALVPVAMDSSEPRIRAAAADLIWLLAPVDNGEAMLWDKLGFRREGPDDPPLWAGEWAQKRLVTALGRVGSPEAIAHLERLVAGVKARPEPEQPGARRWRRELERSLARAIDDLQRRYGQLAR